MKRFRKVLLALAALLGVVIVGGIWLINSALNVASDVVDSTLSGAQKVQAVAQREIAGAEGNAQKSAKATPGGAEKSPDAADKPATVETPPVTQADNNAPAPNVLTLPTENSAANQTADKVTSSAPKPSAAANPKNSPKEEDSLAEIGNLLSLFFNDGEDDASLAGLIKSGDGDATGGEAKDGDKTAENKTGGKKDDDSLTDLIPGANSPTVKGWMAGKYKGKEAQAFDDALEDPKFLRMLFFLGGGM